MRPPSPDERRPPRALSQAAVCCGGVAAFGAYSRSHSRSTGQPWRRRTSKSTALHKTIHDRSWSSRPDAVRSADQDAIVIADALNMAFDVLPASPSRSAGQRRPPSRRTAALLAAVGVTAAVAVGGLMWTSRSTPSASAGKPPAHPTVAAAPTPEQLLTRAKSAMTSAGSVHFVLSASIPGVSIVGDAGLTSGQSTFTDGPKRATELAVRQYIFVSANAAALAAGADGLSDFTPAEKAKIAAGWLRIQPGQPGYNDVTSVGTLPDLRDTQIVFAGAVTKVPVATRDGQQVVGISGAVGGSNADPGETGTLWISPRTDLPVQYVTTEPGGSVTIDFSLWGHAADVVAPGTFQTMTAGITQAG